MVDYIWQYCRYGSGMIVDYELLEGRGSCNTEHAGALCKTSLHG